jgi:hypothetical protein
LSDTDQGHGHHHEDAIAACFEFSHNAVTVGIGEVVATGGHESVSIMHFLRHKMVIHVGKSVEWTNNDPVTPYIITFGVEPTNTIPPAGTVTADGASMPPSHPRQTTTWLHRRRGA